MDDITTITTGAAVFIFQETFRGLGPDRPAVGMAQQADFPAAQRCDLVPHGARASVYMSAAGRCSAEQVGRRGQWTS